MAPFVKRLEVAATKGHPIALSRLAQDYLQVCRWPFRQLEYSFAFDAIAAVGTRSGTLLEAGCGVTPFGHALAAQGHRVYACDYDRNLMGQLGESGMERVYGSKVDYSWQNLAELDFPDSSFDTVTCISVIEHIPPPFDRRALHQLVRALKPGGLLVLTVDFAPDGSAQKGATRYGERLLDLVRRGQLLEIAAAGVRKLNAARVKASGEARHIRSADQCFQTSHLKDDLLPELAGGDTSFTTEYLRPLSQVSADDVEGFWNIEPGLFAVQRRRIVLPAAVAFVKR
jgi:2-polyprenyl-3-methyl-5-hydroxy-6-metoxy-1,4-benzoquinol methylase